MFLIRCYVGVAFEIFIRGKQQHQHQQGNQQDDTGKKRKREKEAASAEAAKDAKGKNRKKQNKKSKGKKQDDDDEVSTNDTQTTTNGNDTTPPKPEQETTKWSDLETYITILEEGPLNPLNFDPDQPTSIDEETDYVPMPHGPDGLRYHIMDLWLDELEKVLEFENYGNENETEKEEEVEREEEHRPRKLISDVPMDLLLRPMEKLRAQGVHKPVRTRASEYLQDERLFEWGVKERKVKKSEDDEEDEEESEEEWGGFGDD